MEERINDSGIIEWLEALKNSFVTKADEVEKTIHSIHLSDPGIKRMMVNNLEDMETFQRSKMTIMLRVLTMRLYNLKVFNDLRLQRREDAHLQIGMLQFFDEDIMKKHQYGMDHANIELSYIYRRQKLLENLLKGTESIDKIEALKNYYHELEILNKNLRQELLKNACIKLNFPPATFDKEKPGEIFGFLEYRVLYEYAELLALKSRRVVGSKRFKLAPLTPAHLMRKLLTEHIGLDFTDRTAISREYKDVAIATLADYIVPWKKEVLKLSN
ncbi:uncharacterized protein PHALS_04380 [Plasmopara halstedii]|uniref:Uncharacterized protein n=1 Tax=Plasmopara halstedii TaxID=4781 RepID=A0A0P1AYI0_PLAHL|nr:uncharacterized protein PHALS_04380 [Plasmopara halstedii]CEG47512.1 hypothetical protein PHALS_04380 [Plasmopara halstedii]|eukprot:XP_024583881.1 hypothetical protein PHALS_04380 [Plasmopara halstedii]